MSVLGFASRPFRQPIRKCSDACVNDGFDSRINAGFDDKIGTMESVPNINGLR